MTEFDSCLGFRRNPKFAARRFDFHLEHLWCTVTFRQVPGPKGGCCKEVVSQAAQSRFLACWSTAWWRCSHSAPDSVQDEDMQLSRSCVSADLVLMQAHHSWHERRLGAPGVAGMWHRAGASDRQAVQHLSWSSHSEIYLKLVSCCACKRPCTLVAAQILPK